MSQSVTRAPLAPFAASIRRVVDAMLQEQAEAGAPEPCARFEVGDGVAALVDLWGGATGVVGVHFPRDAALRIVELATGRPPAFGTPGFDDAIAELAEMIVVGAKGALSDREIGASRPRVVYDEVVEPRTPGAVLPIWTDSGAFSVWTALDAGGEA